MKNEKKSGECCPNCFWKERYSGEDGLVSVCDDPGCLCHNPLKMSTGDTAEPKDRFGRL